jgi:sterol desaturase/sphingolipid hydroxylase (fatty acid hydroxylase superfamily)
MRHFFGTTLKVAAGGVMIYHGHRGYGVWYWAIGSWLVFFVLIDLSYKVDHNSRRWY